MITANKITIKSGTKSAETALKQMTSTWLANVCRIEAITPDGKRIDITHNRAVLRNDLSTPEAVLGVVGLVYTPIQNTDAFAFFDIITNQYKGTYEYGFVVDNGRQIILVAKVGDNYEVRPGDVISDHITVINSFDGSIPYKAFFTPIRHASGAICRAEVGGTVNSVAIRHTKTANNRMQDAMKVLNVSSQYFQQFKDLSKRLAQKAINTNIIEKFLEEVFGEAKTQPNKEKIEAVANLIRNGKGNTGKSLWDAYNGVTEWVDFHRYAGKADSTSKNAGSAILTGIGLKERAFKIATYLL
jgi:hypothetical protein